MEKNTHVEARWNGKTIAQSNKTIVVEGNHYFPPEAVNMEYLRENETKTVCHWKGTASYYDIVVDGQKNEDAAWYYPETSYSARPIEGYIAFWHGVEVAKASEVEYMR